MELTAYPIGFFLWVIGWIIQAVIFFYRDRIYGIDRVNYWGSGSWDYEE